MRFILAVVCGELKLSNRRKADIEAELEDEGYDKLPSQKKAKAQVGGTAWGLLCGVLCGVLWWWGVRVAAGAAVGCDGLPHRCDASAAVGRSVMVLH